MSETKEEFEIQQTIVPSSPGTPHSRDAEEAVVGAVLINPEAFFEVSAFLRPEDFYIHRLRWTWEAIVSLQSKNIPVDLLTLSEELDRQGKLNDIGGSAYLTSLINQVPTSLNAESYARIVQADSTRRRLINAANTIASLGYSGDDVSVLTNNAIAAVQQAVSNFLGQDVYHASLPYTTVYDWTMDAVEGKTINYGIPTKIGTLDSILKRLKPGQLIVIAGRPGTGKTAFKLSVAHNAAHQHRRVVVFSLEMTKEEIIQRLIAIETGIALDKILDGKMSQDELNKFNDAAVFFENSQIFIDDTPAINTLQIEARTRQVAMQYGPVDLVVVDYLQIMSAGKKTSNRTEEVSAISRGLKDVARKLNIPFLVGAQLNREVEKENRRPRLSDLRESGSIEADADIIIFPYIENDEDDLAPKSSKHNHLTVPLKLIVGKHRNGPVGDADAVFHKALTKFL